MLSESLQCARQARSSGLWHEALAGYEAAIPVAARHGSAAEVAELFLEIGSLHRERGDLELAAEAVGVAAAIAEANADERALARALTRLAGVLVTGGRLGEAAPVVERARHLAGALSLAGVEARVELTAAELHLRQGETERSMESCERAFELFRALRSAPGLSEAHRWYAVLHRSRSQESLARAHLGAAVEAARACDDRLLEAEALREYAALHLDGGRHRDAVEALNSAWRIFADLSLGGALADLDERLDGLEEAYLLTVRRWAEQIEAKDRHTAGHCERVATYACLLARQLGIKGRELVWIQMGAYLHDVGKVSVPAEVLNHVGGLTPDEWARVQQHTVDGDEIIASLNLPWDIRAMVRSHHERWDGYGYPDGLAGEEIPLTARIVCLADVYDALTTDRSFRDAFPREEALRIMDGEVGRIFDPGLFPLFRLLVLGRAPRDARRSVPLQARASAA